MTSNEQMDLWVEGKSVHNPDRDECCPDFSCCRPDLLAPVEERKLFRDRPEIRHDMLMMFLSKAIASYNPDKKVYVAGFEHE